MGVADILSLFGASGPAGLAGVLPTRRKPLAGLATAVDTPDHPMFADQGEISDFDQPDVSAIDMPKISAPRPTFADLRSDPMFLMGLNLLGQRGWSTTPDGGFGSNLAKAATATGGQLDAQQDRTDRRSLAQANLSLAIAKARREAAEARKPTLTSAKDGTVLSTALGDDGTYGTTALYKATPEIQQQAEQAGLQEGTPEYQAFVRRSLLKTADPGYMADNAKIEREKLGIQHQNRLGEIGAEGVQQRLTKQTVGAGDDVGSALDPDTVQYLSDRFRQSSLLPPLGQGKAAAGMRALVLKKAAADAKASGLTGYDDVATGADFKANSSALSNLQKQGAMVKQFEGTASRNADIILEQLGKGAGTTGVPVLNRWQQAGRKAIAGDPDVATFHTAVVTFANEYAKVMSGGGASPLSDSARHEVESLINTSQTPQQIKANVALMKRDMANRRSSIEAEAGELRSKLRTGPASARSTNDPLGIR